MVLTIYVGNTHIVMGVMRQDQIITRFKLTTQIKRTSDEYGITLLEMLSQKQIPVEAIEGVIIASVVPDMMYSLKNSVKKYLNQQPLVVGEGIKTGINIRTDHPKEVGAGRIANCVAAYQMMEDACIAIDFGTATTYDIVSREGDLVAAITSPGLKICAQALWQNSAQLPQVEIRKTKHILDAKNTMTSIQTGLVYGYIGQVEYIIKEVRKAMNEPGMKVIATGGLAKIIMEGTKLIDHYDALLTLKGLNIIYDKNR